ncbi:aldo/keto reductase [Mucilaginibacter sp.]|uniref:aldo/keto reductase n=1 Tax=Mucilaginibacter sp. TaxID=1882438 RepID=UPI00260FC44A|nr:aldo/keto reductase [Mucilaginibacter sp.]
MNYKTLGRSGLRVSPICLGGMTLGEDWGWGADEAESEKIIKRFMELGGNFIDTANLYTNNHSEKIIGNVIGNHSSIRAGMVLATKFGMNVFPGNPNGGGSGTKAIMENVHHSLRRLRTDYIDLLWIHAWDWNTPLEETLRTMNDLVSVGKVRYIGVSGAPAWKIAQSQMFAQFKGWAPFIGLQIEYSLLERTVEAELVPMAMEMGLGITTWSPLRGGLLSGKYNRSNNGFVKDSRMQVTGREAPLKEHELAIIDKLEEIAKAHRTTVAAVALAWLLSRSGVCSTIIGVRNIKQLEANAGAIAIVLTEDEITALNNLSAPPVTFVNAHTAATLLAQHGGIKINGVKPPSSPLMDVIQVGKY